MEKPSLPPPTEGSNEAPRPIADQFAAESRDEAWATITEGVIAKRLDNVPAKLSTECRAVHCQITVDGDSATVEKTIALMESEAGLQGISRQILLGKPEPRPDGTLSLKLHVTFER